MKQRIREAFERFDDDPRVQGTIDDEGHKQALAAFEEAIAPLLSDKAIIAKKRRRPMAINSGFGVMWDVFGIPDERRRKMTELSQRLTGSGLRGGDLIRALARKKMNDAEWTACIYLIGMGAARGH